MGTRHNKHIPCMAWQQLAQSTAEPMLWINLVQCYATAGLHWQAGHVARQALRNDVTLLPQLQTLKLGSWQDASAGDDLLGRAVLPEAAQLTEWFYDWLEKYPGDWLTWLYQARLHEMQVVPEVGDSTSLMTGDRQHSDYALQQAQKLEFLPGESLHWMGVWRLKAGDADGAVDALSSLLYVHPDRNNTLMCLGEPLLQVGLETAAERVFARAALAPHPDY